MDIKTNPSEKRPFTKRKLIQSGEDKVSIVQIIGFTLIFIGVIYLICKLLCPCCTAFTGAELAIDFFIIMLGVAFAFPDLLQDNTGGLSTMRIVVFMMVNVICILLLDIGWGKPSLTVIGLDPYWVGVIAFVFGSKATQSYFESKMADVTKVANTVVSPQAATVNQPTNTNRQSGAGNFQYQLGKTIAKTDLRTLKFGDYFNAQELPTPPDSVAWGNQLLANWGMMQNDNFPDCTCAAAGHMIMNWTGNVNSKTPIVLSDSQIMQAYMKVSGYDPATGENKTGIACLDVLKLWNQNGIGGHVINAYVSLDVSNQSYIKNAIYLFGGCYIGLQLPNSLKDTSNSWTVPATGAVANDAPNPNNGHCVNIVGYDTNNLTVISWGTVKSMSWDFFAAYADEAYAILSNDWFNSSSGKNPDGFDVTSMQNDLNAIKNTPAS